MSMYKEISKAIGWATGNYNLLWYWNIQKHNKSNGYDPYNTVREYKRS